MRTFTPSTLVTLPAVDAHEAIALAAGLEAAANPPSTGKKKHDEAAHALPKTVSSAIALIAARRLALQQSVGSTPAPGPDRRAADHAEDEAVGALYDLLTAWERLPDSVAQAKTARALRPLLFPEGIEIVKLRFQAEWAAVESLLKKVDAAVAKQLDALGASPMIAHLRTVHAAYGKALGVTETHAPAESPKVRAQWEALLEAVRTYVLRVAATVEEDDPKTKARADAWLAPLTSWESAPRPKKVPAPAGGAAGAPTGGGTS